MIFKYHTRNSSIENELISPHLLLESTNSTAMALDYLCFSAFFISVGLFSCFGAFAFWDILSHGNTSIALFMASLFFISNGFMLANGYLKLLANKYSKQSATKEEETFSFYDFLRHTFSIIGSLGVLFGFAYFLYDQHVHSFNVQSWNTNACLWVGIIGFISISYVGLAIWKHSKFSIPLWLEKLNTWLKKPKSSDVEVQKGTSVCDTPNKYSITIGIFAALNLAVLFVNSYAFASSKDFLGNDPKLMWFYCIIATICTTVLLTKEYFLEAERAYDKEVGNEKEKTNKWFAPTTCKGIFNVFEIGGIPFQAVGLYFLTWHWPDTKHPISLSTTQKMYLTFGISVVVFLACMIRIYNIYLQNEYGSNDALENNQSHHSSNLLILSITATDEKKSDSFTPT